MTSFESMEELPLYHLGESPDIESLESRLSNLETVLSQTKNPQYNFELLKFVIQCAPMLALRILIALEAGELEVLEDPALDQFKENV